MYNNASNPEHNSQKKWSKLAIISFVVFLSAIGSFIIGIILQIAKIYNIAKIFILFIPIIAYVLAFILAIIDLFINKNIDKKTKHKTLGFLFGSLSTAVITFIIMLLLGLGLIITIWITILANLKGF